MTSEELDAQRIALVATLATTIYAAVIGSVPDWGQTSEAMRSGCVKHALNLVQLAEQAVRAPTGDA